MSETLTVVLVKLHSAAQFLCVLMHLESVTQAGHAAPLPTSTSLSLSDEKCNPDGWSSTSWLAPCQSSHRASPFSPVSVGKNKLWGCLHWLLIRWSLNTHWLFPSPLSSRCLWAEHGARMDPAVRGWRVGVHAGVGPASPSLPCSMNKCKDESETSGLLSVSEGSFCQAPGSAAQLPANRPFHVPSESFFF